MKRKIEDFLRELQPEHAEAALIEFNKPESKEWRGEKGKHGFVESHKEALWYAFQWVEDFWIHVYQSLHDKTYIFPSPQESQDEIWDDVRNVLDGGGKIVDDEWVRPYEYLKSKYKIERI